MIRDRDVIRLAHYWARVADWRSWAWVYDWTSGPGYGARRPTTKAERRDAWLKRIPGARAELEAQDARRIEREATAVRDVATLERIIVGMENTERLGFEGMAQMREIDRELTEARRRERAK